MNRSPSFLWLSAIGILVFFGIRLHSLDAIPLFIDESIAIERSENILDGILLQHARTGKLLLPYYLLPFQPHTNSVWIARLSFLIPTCLGLAGATAIACRFGGRRAGLLAILSITFSPMLFFFDRLVLADTMLHVAFTIWIWSLFKVFDRPRPGITMAILCGALYVVALFAKAPALFLLPLPILFARVMPGWRFADRFKVLGWLYGTVAALWLPFTLLLSSRRIDYFGKSDGALSSASALFDFSRMGNNLSHLLDVLTTYDGAVFMLAVAVSCLAAVLRKPGPLFLLLASVAGYEIALIWLGGEALFNRYFVPVLPLLLVAASISLTVVSQAAKRRFKHDVFPILVGLMLVWIVTVSLPFIQDLYRDPSSAGLARGDWHEYIGRNSSGFGIPELSDYLKQLAADDTIVVEGALVGCYTLRLYLEADKSVALQCPNVLSGERRAKYLNVHLPREAKSHERYYLVLEIGGLVAREELTGVELTLIAEFPRPGNISRMQLYAVTG